MGATLLYGLTTMNPALREIPPFAIKDCALIQIATGVRAQKDLSAFPQPEHTVANEVLDASLAL
jgi:hypothetical protein